MNRIGIDFGGAKIEARAGASMREILIDLSGAQGVRDFTTP
jgi:hypothetical protein